MTNTVTSLGTLLVFAMVLPGLLGYGIIGILLPQHHLFEESPSYLLAVTFLIGFVSNTIGHATGVIYRLIFSPARDFPFSLYAFSYEYPSVGKAIRFRKDIDYWFNYYCWYWNSGTAVLLAIILKLTVNKLDPTSDLIDGNMILVLLCFLGIAILLFLMSHHVMKSIVRTKERLVRENYGRSQ